MTQNFQLNPDFEFPLTPEESARTQANLLTQTSTIPASYSQQSFKSVSRQDRKTCMENSFLTPKQAAHLRTTLSKCSNELAVRLEEFFKLPGGILYNRLIKFILSNEESTTTSSDEENFRLYFSPVIERFSIGLHPNSPNFLRVLLNLASKYYEHQVKLYSVNLASVTIISGFHPSFPMNMSWELSTLSTQFYYTRLAISNSLQNRLTYVRRLTENEKTSFLHD